MSETLFLEPVDVWSFRDGRPFEAGESFEARSVFPPFPWTVLGCLRTTVLRKYCPSPELYARRSESNSCSQCGDGPCVAEAIVGKAGEEAPFSIGPGLLAWIEDDGGASAYYPTPRDLICETDKWPQGPMRFLVPVQPVKNAICSTRGLLPVAAIGAARVESLPDGWIGQEALTRALAGEVPCLVREDLPGVLREPPPGVLREPRIGVGIDAKDRSARRGQLYLRDVVRLHEGPDGRAGLLVQVSQPLDVDGEIGRLGGDGRMVAISRVPRPTLITPPPTAARFKVYFASPTWFEGGWRPRWIDESSLEGTIPGTGVRARLVSAITGDPVAVGGWDLKHQRPRPLRPMIGAGAVYSFELLKGEPEAAISAFHGKSLCDDPSMSKAGFGFAFMGRY
jgi:CRISPR-associated protein Cmr3